MTSPTQPHTTVVHADKLTGAAWFKSSYSSGGEQCVEVADLRRSPLAAVAVRDSKEANGPALLFTPFAFSRFVSGGVRGDESVV
ncbi:DUF397 domain-containing protein [Streptomyces sp. NPDC058045]|uniref:DUF397 domain-containing protein n=1 Tax=Streptomyces sp. NPDC058045 TaxID=3346311 RepID=UPI0036EC02DB